MKRAFAFVVVLCVVVPAAVGNVVPSSSDGDARYRAERRYGVPAEYRRLLAIAKVRTELKINAQQFSELNGVIDDNWWVADGSDKSAEMQVLEAELNQVLSAEQWKRCVELRIQNAGVAALLRGDVATKLKLTKPQTETLNAIAQQEISDSFQAGFRLGFRPDLPSPAELKANAIARRDRGYRALKKGLTVLTPQQRKQFSRMCGKRFRFPVVVI